MLKALHYLNITKGDIMIILKANKNIGFVEVGKEYIFGELVHNRDLVHVMTMDKRVVPGSYDVAIFDTSRKEIMLKIKG